MTNEWAGFDSISKHEKAIKELQTDSYQCKHDIEQLKESQNAYNEELNHFEFCFDFLNERIKDAENQTNICSRNCIILIILTFICYALPHLINGV